MPLLPGLPCAAGSWRASSRATAAPATSWMERGRAEEDVRDHPTGEQRVTVVEGPAQRGDRIYRVRGELAHQVQDQEPLRRLPRSVGERKANEDGEEEDVDCWIGHGNDSRQRRQSGEPDIGLHQEDPGED